MVAEQAVERLVAWADLVQARTWLRRAGQHTGVMSAQQQQSLTTIRGATALLTAALRPTGARDLGEND